MKAFSSSHLTCIWSVRSALAVAFLATTACGSGDDTAAATPPDAAPDNTVPTPDSGGDTSTTTPDAGGDTSTPTPDAGGDTSTTPPTDGGAGEAEAGAVTWQQVYTDVVTQHCIGCHEPPPPDAGAKGGFAVGHLDMGSVDAGYANLVNQPPQGTASPILPDASVCDTLSADAGSDSGLLRVTPGSPAASLFYLKVNGYVTAPPCGSPMPPTVATFTEIPDGGQATAAAEIQAWITQGAKP